MILATSITDNYFRGAELWWLPGVNKYSPFSNFCLCLDFTPPEDVTYRFPNVTFVPYSSANMLAKHSNNCVQHGDFLQGLPISESNPVIIFSDADIIMQRSPTTEEVVWLNSFSDMTFSAGDNENPAEHQSLYDYSRILQPNCNYDVEISNHFNDIDKNIYICNGGMLVGKLTAWKELFARYVDLSTYVFPRLGHIAKQQYLISLVIQQSPFEFRLLSRLFSSHGHDGLHRNIHLVNKDGFAYTYYGDEPVLFAHHITLPEREMIW